MELRRYLPLLASLAFAHTATAQDITKANNTDTLDLATSWVGGSVPGVSDIAVWDATVSAAKSVAFGADQSWQGIKVTNPVGTVSILGTNTLTLGTSGIDLSAATQNLTLGPPLVVAADQSWTVGSGGLALNGGGIGSNNTTGRTLANPVSIGGNVEFGGSGLSSGTSTGSLTVDAAGTAIGLTGVATTPSLTVSGATLNGPVAGSFLGAPVGDTTYDVLTCGTGGVTNPET